MLIHLSPRLYLAFRNETPAVDLVDITIAELGMQLRGGVDLATRRPYPNKNYVVACKKMGQKAINGILIETPSHVEKFTLVARWAINGSPILHTHRVEYTVLDCEHDAVSESMVLWYATCASLGSWQSRWPGELAYPAPVHAQPRMDLWPVDLGGAERKGRQLVDVLAPNGLIVERSEQFSLPTIENGRLSSRFEKRLPSMDMAFIAMPSELETV
jgi:hypothetical protein